MSKASCKRLLGASEPQCFSQASSCDAQEKARYQTRNAEIPTHRINPLYVQCHKQSAQQPDTIFSFTYPTGQTLISAQGSLLLCDIIPPEIYQIPFQRSIYAPCFHLKCLVLPKKHCVTHAMPPLPALKKERRP